MGLVRESVLEIAYLRPGKHSRPQSFVGFGDASGLVTNAAETARAPERRLEELGREVVTTNAGVMREVFGHRLIGVFGFLFGRKMAINALNLDVFLLIVRKASVPGSVFDLFNRERSLFVCTRRRENNPAGEYGRSAQQKEQLRIEN
jgi:hypothetical protein